MTAHNRISVLIVAVALGIPAAAAPAQSAIATEQIAAALSSAGINTTPEQVVLLTNVVATTTTPALKVESAGALERSPDEGPSKLRKTRGMLAILRGGWGNQPQAGLPVLAPSTGIPQTKPNSPAMRAGAHATLLLEGGHLHIKLPVLCLENGAIGQTIRVSSLDHRLTYVAQVDANLTLRGKLQ